MQLLKVQARLAMLLHLQHLQPLKNQSVRHVVHVLKRKERGINGIIISFNENLFHSFPCSLQHHG